MAAPGQVTSATATKVFTMSPQEENYRTKFRRHSDSPDISKAVPVFVPSFGNPPSSVFSFTATRNEPSQARDRTEHLRSHIKGTTMRCRVCKRPKIMKACSTSESKLLAGKQWDFSRDEITNHGISSSMNSVKFKRQEPSRLPVHSSANSKSINGFHSQCIAATSDSTSALACPNFIAMSTFPSEDQNYADKKLEDADQIVKDASDMVKLLESRIAALQLSIQALKTTSERKTALQIQASPMNSYLNSKIEGAVNPFRLIKKHKLVETSLPPRPPSDQFLSAASICGQQTPNLLNLSPVITFPHQTPSRAPSMSYVSSQRQYVPPCQGGRSLSQRQSTALSENLEPSPKQSSVKNHKLNRIPSQKQTSTPGVDVKNIVQRLESLKMSPSRSETSNRHPKCVNKLERDNIQHRSGTGDAGTVESSWSGVNRPSKPRNYSQSRTRRAELTRKVRGPKSKLSRSHMIPTRQQSSDYSDDSGSSSSPSSWTTAQQSASESGSEESDEYSSSSASLPSQTQTESSITPESSEYSAEATTSSPTQIQVSRRKLSRPRSFNRRQRKDRSSSKEKPISRLRRIKNKLGLIFHHHHHHHHHHHEAEKPKSLWKKVNQKTVVRQSRDAGVKKSMAVKERDQQVGHFHALIDGLLRHMRLQKKKKKKMTPLKGLGRGKKNVVQWGKVIKHHRRLNLRKIKT